MTTLEYASQHDTGSTRLVRRAIVFALAATSIGALLVEFYGLMSMRAFALWVCAPAMLALVVWAIVDRRDVRRIIWIGAVAGFIAACAYDVFRLPFVFARELHIDSLVPALPLFKVFPLFGRMLTGRIGEDYYLGAPATGGPLYHIDWIDHTVGWAYHFSNGMTFGIMYLAMIGDATKRSWLWAVAFAVGLEVALLVTPYASFFGIHKTPTFVTVTMAAHVVFGVFLGWSARWLSGVREDPSPRSG